MKVLFGRQLPLVIVNVQPHPPSFTLSSLPIAQPRCRVLVCEHHHLASSKAGNDSLTYLCDLCAFVLPHEHFTTRLKLQASVPAGAPVLPL